MIDHGHVIANGTADELKDQIGGDRLRVSIARAENRDAAVEVRRPTLDDVFLTLTGRPADDALEEVPA